MADKSGKYGNLIKAAKQGKSKDVEPVSESKNNPEDPVVSLTIKVPRSLRQHWSGQAKLNGSSITADIIEALTEKYGKP